MTLVATDESRIVSIPELHSGYTCEVVNNACEEEIGEVRRLRYEAYKPINESAGEYKAANVGLGPNDIHLIVRDAEGKPSFLVSFEVSSGKEDNDSDKRSLPLGLHLMADANRMSQLGYLLKSDYPNHTYMTIMESYKYLDPEKTTIAEMGSFALFKKNGTVGITSFAEVKILMHTALCGFKSALASRGYNTDEVILCGIVRDNLLALFDRSGAEYTLAGQLYPNFYGKNPDNSSSLPNNLGYFREYHPYWFTRIMRDGNQYYQDFLSAAPNQLLANYISQSETGVKRHLLAPSVIHARLEDFINSFEKL